MKIEIIISILLIHWILDFVCQTEWQAANKSSRWDALLSHTWWYSVGWFFAISLYVLIYVSYCVFSHIPIVRTPWIMGLFPLITFITHTIIDYITSRETKKLWENKKTHDFFVVIGFDQLLHVTQLLLTFYYLTK